MVRQRHTSTEDQPLAQQLPSFNYPCGLIPCTKEAKTLQPFLTTVIMEAIVQQTKLFASQKGVSLQL